MRIPILFALLLGACSQTGEEAPRAYESRVWEAFASKPEGKSMAYALKKESMGVTSWLATIHGYPDNATVCEELIKPYNSDPDLSVIEGRYFCQPIEPKTN